MSKVSIIPQRFTFTKESIYNGYGKLTSPGINVTIEIDAFQCDKGKVKENLSSIFAEVLEYFD